VALFVSGTGTLVHFDVANIGSFNYDVFNLYLFGLQARCN
jgi:hypothetical protein